MAGISSSRRKTGLLERLPIKHITIAALVCQNALLVLMLHYSRIMPLVNGKRYLASTAIFLSEAIKLAFFLSMAIYDVAMRPHSSDTSTISELGAALSRAVFTGDSWKLAIPAVMYTVQNSLQYIAASNLDPVTFATTYQLKIAMTALAAFLLMGALYNGRQMLGLGLLVVGVLAVQAASLSTAEDAMEIISVHDLRAGMGSKHSRRSAGMWDLQELGNEAVEVLTKRSATYEGIEHDFAAANPQKDIATGLALAVLACVLSGAAGVYFERLLKVKSTEFGSSIWVRNVQLTFYSLWPTLFIGVLFLDGEYIAKTGFFTGYNSTVWAVILLQAMGGVLVALTLDQISVVEKSTIAALSSPLITVISAVVLRTQVTTWALLGSIITAAGAYLFAFARPSTHSTRPPQVNISQYEKSSEGYFDHIPGSGTGTAPRSPLRESTRATLSTSRPGTPVSERRSLRSKSGDRQMKREQ